MKSNGKIVWRIFEALPGDKWSFRLNGIEVTTTNLQEVWQGSPACLTHYGAGIGAHTTFEIDLQHAPPLGLHNELEITALCLSDEVRVAREMKILNLNVKA